MGPNGPDGPQPDLGGKVKTLSKAPYHVGIIFKKKRVLSKMHNIKKNVTGMLGSWRTFAAFSGDCSSFGALVE